MIIGLLIPFYKERNKRKKDKVENKKKRRKKRKKENYRTARMKWNDRQSQLMFHHDEVSFYGLLIPNLSCTPRSSNIGQYHALFSQYASDTNLHTARVTHVVNREVAERKRERERERKEASIRLTRWTKVGQQLLFGHQNF